MFENSIVNILSAPWFRASVCYLVLFTNLAVVEAARAQNMAVTMEDTVETTAERVAVDEVIAAVGKKMEDDWAKIEDHEFTGLFTSITRDNPGINGGNYTLYESAARFRLTRGGDKHQVRLWQRKRRYEENLVISDEVDDQVEAVWAEAGSALIEATPFLPESGNRYNYEILDRKLVGNSLVYKIRFIPRSQFEALPSGIVWIDYSNWVIRKVDAAMTGVVPMPFLVRDVPFYRMTKVQVGDFWVNGETHTLARLRSVPFVPVPNNIDVKFVAVDHVINGLQGTVPAMIDTSEFWLSEAEAKQEQEAYWGSLEKDFSFWSSEQFRCDNPMACGDLDSLAAVGSAELDKMGQGKVWDTSFSIVKEPGFNRVQGPVLRVGVNVEQVGQRGTTFSAGLGYGVASERPVWSIDVELPLISSSWNGVSGRGIQYTAVEVGLSAAQKAVRFAGDSRVTSYERSLSAFLYGGDPNHYYENRSVAVDLKWRVSRRASLRLEGSYARQKPMVQKTSWNLLGEDLKPAGNREIYGQHVGFMGVGFKWTRGPWKLDGIWGVQHISDSRFLAIYGGGEQLSSVETLKVSGSWDYLDPAGNRWIVKGNYFALGEIAADQMQTWYGDWGSLRGYPAGVLHGEVGQNAAIDLRFGFDFWKALGVPVLRDLGIQHHVFVDYAVARSKVEMNSVRKNQGTLWDVGFGFGKLVGSVGGGGPAYLRVHAAVPVGNGSEGYPWRVLVGLGN